MNMKHCVTAHLSNHKAGQKRILIKCINVSWKPHKVGLTYPTNACSAHTVQYSMHVPPTSTHRNVDVTLHVVWRSPQSWCSCDSDLNQQDPTRTDWARSQGCTHAYPCKCVSLSVLRLWVCAGTICEACVWMWKWMKVGEGKGDHVGWISHFCFKKMKRSLNSDENLGVNKEKLLVTLAPVGLPRPVTSSESEAIYSVIHRNTSISNQPLFQ